MRVSEIRVKQIRVNQGLGVHESFDSLHSARSGFRVAAIFLQEST